MNVERYKQVAKKLFKRTAVDDELCQVIAMTIIKSKDQWSLMTIQHFVAQKAGFADWDEVVHATDDQRRAGFAQLREKGFVK